MSFHGLSTQTISAVFLEELQAHSGRVTDTYDDGRRLLTRSLLPFVDDVRPSDRMQGGVALRADESEIALHPYLFREVCRNGAIISQSLGACFVEYPAYATEDDVVRSLRDAMHECCAKDVFTTSLAKVRDSVHASADLALNLMPLLQGLRGAFAADVIEKIFSMFTSDKDRSRFGLMNVVTAIARDVRDPEQRWRLEELGGAIGAGLRPRVPVDSEGARRLIPS